MQGTRLRSGLFVQKWPMVKNHLSGNIDYRTSIDTFLTARRLPARRGCSDWE